MTRIIAGAAGGRRLETPAGANTRPTSDRVREAVFSRLDAVGMLPGARVLDLFAGSGALGLEAASRGASYVVLVDSSREAASVARRNSAVVEAAVVEAAVGAAEIRVVLAPALRHLERSTDRSMDLVFLDPPYALPEASLEEHLEALVTGGWLAPEAMVVVERSARSPEPRWPAGLRQEQVRRYGETGVWTAIHTSDHPGP